MKTYREKKTAELIRAQKTVARLKKDLFDVAAAYKHDTLAALSEHIENYLNYHDQEHNICLYWGTELAIRTDNLDQYLFEDLMDFIDNYLEFENYFLDTNYSNYSNNTYKFRYDKPDSYDYYNLEFASLSCKTINTGKLIPEIKKVCSFIQT